MSPSMKTYLDVSREYDLARFFYSFTPQQPSEQVIRFPPHPHPPPPLNIGSNSNPFAIFLLEWLVDCVFKDERRGKVPSLWSLL